MPHATSIEASYRRVTPDEFARLQGDAKAAESFFGTSLEDLDDSEKLLARMEEQESSDRHVGIGTDWHALHFLLAGDGDLKPHPLPPPPLGNVVQGGTETLWPCTYGHVHSLTPDEVHAVADALSKISVEELRSRFSVASYHRVFVDVIKLLWLTENARHHLIVNHGHCVEALTIALQN